MTQAGRNFVQSGSKADGLVAIEIYIVRLVVSGLSARLLCHQTSLIHHRLLIGRPLGNWQRWRQRVFVPSCWQRMRQALAKVAIKMLKIAQQYDIISWETEQKLVAHHQDSQKTQNPQKCEKQFFYEAQLSSPSKQTSNRIRLNKPGWHRVPLFIAGAKTQLKHHCRYHGKTKGRL